MTTKDQIHPNEVIAAMKLKIGDLRDENTNLTNKVVGIVRWLEQNQPDVFKRGIWDVIHDAKK
jgi:hypothetical protein